MLRSKKPAAARFLCEEPDVFLFFLIPVLPALHSALPYTGETALEGGTRQGVRDFDPRMGAVARTAAENG
jgi:hypothetical protein